MKFFEGLRILAFILFYYFISKRLFEGCCLFCLLVLQYFMEKKHQFEYNASYVWDRDNIGSQENDDRTSIKASTGLGE